MAMQEPCAVRGKDFALRETGENLGILSDAVRHDGWGDPQACVKSEHVIAFHSVKTVEYGHARRAPRPPSVVNAG
ncbi:hypothetical protein GFM18_31660 [Rhizobium laguerreae]|nr:hypothetical protein [Rhizobium laguerreae]